MSMEKGRTPSHDDDYLKSSALKDLERLGVTGAGASYKGNIRLDQPKVSGWQNQKEGGAAHLSLSEVSNQARSKKQKSDGPGFGDSSISCKTRSIAGMKNLGEYIEHLSESFDLPGDEKMMFNKNVMKLAMDCEIGRSGLSTTLTGRTFYTVVHIMQDNDGYTVTHSHHTMSMEKGRTPSHDDDFLKSSALKDLERLGVRGAGASYKGNIRLDSSKSTINHQESEGAANNKDPKPKMSACTDETKK